MRRANSVKLLTTGPSGPRCRLVPAPSEAQSATITRTPSSLARQRRDGVCAICRHRCDPHKVLRMRAYQTLRVAVRRMERTQCRDALAIFVVVPVEGEQHEFRALRKRRMQRAQALDIRGIRARHVRNTGGVEI